MKMLFRLWALMGRSNHVLDGDPDPPWEGEILRGGRSGSFVKYSDTYCDLCKNGWTNRFVWVVDSTGPKEAQFNRICQVMPMCPHGRAHWRTWQIRLNHLSAAGMRPYVKLLSPVVGCSSPLHCSQSADWAYWTPVRTVIHLTTCPARCWVVTAVITIVIIIRNLSLNLQFLTLLLLVSGNLAMAVRCREPSKRCKAHVHSPVQESSRTWVLHTGTSC